MGESTALLKQNDMEQNWLQSTRESLPPWLKSISGPFLLAITYYLGAQAAFAVGTLSDRIFAPFWPPNIILLCTLLFVPKRQWWLYIAATFPAHLAAEAAVSMPAAQSLVAFGSNCLVAILSAIGVRRFLKQSPWFGTLRNTAIYMLIATVISPAISAFAGAFVQALGDGKMTTYWASWGNWYISNALGSVTLGPILLIWFNARPNGKRLISTRKTEGVVLALSLIGACAIAFHVDSATVTSGFLPALLYLPLPFILWAAIRFGERGASGAILTVTVVSVWENLRASTVFIGTNPSTSVLALQIFLLGIAIPVFFLGTAIDELRRAGEATRRLTGALLHAQDEERRRIARDLHDSTGQNLVMANLMAGQIGNLAPSSCEPVIAELKEILQVAIDEVRTLSYLLHPPVLEGGGLSMALQSYLEGFSKRTGIRVDMELSPSPGTMHSDVELVLFRVIQEALTNIWRHSGSKTARIQFMRQIPANRHQIALSIEDSGIGIPNDIRRSTMSRSNNGQQTPSGLGLIGMRERLHQIGGQLEIHSETGKTVILAIVPSNQKYPLEV
jgi:signal transduction histidine kinase